MGGGRWKGRRGKGGGGNDSMSVKTVAARHVSGINCSERRKRGREEARTEGRKEGRREGM
jgi:hypothetical protein